jgi:hypothetical protein
MNRALSLLALLLASCSIELPDGTIRPVDEYCLPGTCAAGELCFDGSCYEQCKVNDECESGCCRIAKDDLKMYCAPKEKC